MMATTTDRRAEARAAELREMELRRREESERVWTEAIQVASRTMAAIHARLDASERRRAALEAGDRGDTAFRSAADLDNWDRWDPLSRSADDEFGLYGSDLLKLSKRCRDSARNDPVGAAVVGALNRMVMGGRPWNVQSTAREDRLSKIMTPKAVAEWRRACEDVFSDACEHLDARRELDFWEWLATNHRSRLESGDVFVRVTRAKQRKRGQTPIRLRAIEADLCRTPPDKWGETSYRLGVVHVDDVPDAYCIFQEYPDSPRGDTQAYSLARRDDKLGRPQILHSFRKSRIGISRGLPVLSSALRTLEDGSGYEETELVAARAQSCVALIIRNLVPRKAGDPNAPAEQPLEPGMVMNLQADQEAIPFTPTRGGNGTYDGFMARVEKVVCASIGFSSMLAMQDFSEANYSVARMTRLSAEPLIQSEQIYESLRNVRPIWRLVIEDAWADGMLPPVPLFDRDGGPTPYTNELLRCMVLPPSMGWIDPTVEVKAYGEAVREGFMSRREVIAQHTGRSHEEVFRDLGDEERLMDAEGVTQEPAKPAETEA